LVNTQIQIRLAQTNAQLKALSQKLRSLKLAQKIPYIIEIIATHQILEQKKKIDDYLVRIRLQVAQSALSLTLEAIQKRLIVALTRRIQA
jgi:hypothetical protein